MAKPKFGAFASPLQSEVEATAPAAAPSVKRRPCPRSAPPAVAAAATVPPCAAGTGRRVVPPVCRRTPCRRSRLPAGDGQAIDDAEDGFVPVVVPAPVPGAVGA